MEYPGKSASIGCHVTSHHFPSLACHFGSRGDGGARTCPFHWTYRREVKGLAGGLLTASQQIGAAVGLALLATLAAARTEQTHGSLAAGYGFSYLVATGIVLIAMVLVATQLNHKACQSELARQRQEAAQTWSDALLRKG